MNHYTHLNNFDITEGNVSVVNTQLICVLPMVAVADVALVKASTAVSG